MRIPFALCLAAAVASADVVVVEKNGPPGTQPTIQAGVDAAAEFDTVLVRGAGTVVFSEAVVIDGKSVQLVADVGAAPVVRRILVRDLAAGQAVLVRGVDVGTSFGAAALGDAVVLESNAGAVRLEELGAQGGGGSPGTLFSNAVDGGVGLNVFACADVVAVGCTFAGGGGGWLDDEETEFSPSDGGAGVLVRSSTIALLDCDCAGGPGGSVTDTTSDAGGAGGDGILNKTGVVFFSGGSATGGDGGFADCDVFSGFCGSGGRGGDGYHQEFASASVTFRGGALSGGNGGFGGDGTPGLSGQATDLEAGTLSVLPASPRAFDVDSPVREGQSVTLSFDAEPGDTVVLLFGASPTQVFLPAYQGALLVAAPNVVVLGPAMSPPLELSAVVPDLPFGLGDATLHLQAAYDPGGGVLLGPSRALTLLDAPF